MATHSSILAWRVPWMEDPGRLQSMGSLRVRHDWAASLSLFTFMHWRRKWQPTPISLPEDSAWTEEPGGLQSWGRKELDTTERLTQGGKHSLPYPVTSSWQSTLDAQFPDNPLLFVETPEGCVFIPFRILLASSPLCLPVDICQWLGAKWAHRRFCKMVPSCWSHFSYKIPLRHK